MNTKIKLNIKASAVAFAIFLGLILSTNTALARAVISCNSATLEARVSADRDEPTTVWFEWGKTSERNSSYPRMTEQKTFTSDENFSELIAGLEADTSYYYRAIAQNKSGETIGETISFETSPCGNRTTSPTTIVPVYINNPPVTNTIIRETIVRENTNQNNTSNTNSNINTNNSVRNNNDDEDDNSSLSANALSSGYFLPRTLLGWVILFIVLLLIVAALKRYMLPKTVIKTRTLESHY